MLGAALVTRKNGGEEQIIGAVAEFVVFLEKGQDNVGQIVVDGTGLRLPIVTCQNSRRVMRKGCADAPIERNGV